MITYQVDAGTSRLCVTFLDSGIGACRFWLPEGIATPRGFAGVYPAGMSWLEGPDGLRQEAGAHQAFGPGNIKEVAPGVLDSLGVRYVKELPLPWSSHLAFSDARVAFSLSIHNPHGTVAVDVSALLCCKFMHASWWRPGCCYFRTQTGLQSIDDAEWIEGQYRVFQKWHLGPRSPYDNPAMNGIWTANATLVSAPFWVIEHEASDSALLFSCEDAYYIHCNRHNPCNDIALRFGDIAPGETCTRHGYLELIAGGVDAISDRDI